MKSYEDDQFINKWKDNRLKKLEDFNKELMNSVKRNSGKETL